MKPCDLVAEGAVAGLREALLTAGYHADGVLTLLGPAVHETLGRGEPEPARRASKDGGSLGTLIRLFLVGDAEGEQAVREALAPVALDAAIGTGLVRADGDAVRAGLDLRPYGDDQGSWWTIADLDSCQRGAPVDQAGPEGRARTARVAGLVRGAQGPRRTDSAPRVVCEDLRHAFDDPLGPEAAGGLDRVTWLRTHADPSDLLACTLVVADSVVLEDVSVIEDLVSHGMLVPA